MGKSTKYEIYKMYDQYLNSKHVPLKIDNVLYAASEAFKMLDPRSYNMCYYKWVDDQIAAKELSLDGYEYEDFGSPTLAKIIWFDCLEGKGTIQRADGLLMPIVYEIIDGIKPTVAGCPDKLDHERLMGLSSCPVAIVTTGSAKRYTARVTKVYLLESRTAHISSSILKTA